MSLEGTIVLSEPTFVLVHKSACMADVVALREPLRVLRLYVLCGSVRGVGIAARVYPPSPGFAQSTVHENTSYNVLFCASS